jgi:hypothetical protein
MFGTVSQKMMLVLAKLYSSEADAGSWEGAQFQFEKCFPNSKISESISKIFCK